MELKSGFIFLSSTDLEYVSGNVFASR